MGDWVDGWVKEWLGWFAPLVAGKGSVDELVPLVDR